MSDDAFKKAAAAAASASTGGAPPVSPLVVPSTNSYVFFSLLLFPLMITTYAVCVDVLGYQLPVCCMSSMRMFVNLENCIVMIYTWIKLIRKLLIISTVVNSDLSDSTHQGARQGSCFRPPGLAHTAALFSTASLLP